MSGKPCERPPLERSGKRLDVGAECRSGDEAGAPVGDLSYLLLAKARSDAEAFSLVSREAESWAVREIGTLAEERNPGLLREIHSLA
jgi:hypothetical protein